MIWGAVLAGGRSSRFGSDKATARLDGRTLLDLVVERLGRQVDAVLVVGRPHPTVPWASDHPRAGLGPLGGICGALAYIACRNDDAIVTVGCDMPLIPANLVAALAGEGPAIVADCPVLGYWPASLAQPLAAHLESGGDRAVGRWAESVGARMVTLAGPIDNVNTPADLRELAARSEVRC